MTRRSSRAIAPAPEDDCEPPAPSDLRPGPWLSVVRAVAPGGTADALAPVLEDLTDSPAADVAPVPGLLCALWSASAHVSSFGRAMDREHEIDEGRPSWTLRPERRELCEAGRTASSSRGGER